MLVISFKRLSNAVIFRYPHANRCFLVSYTPSSMCTILDDNHHSRIPLASYTLPTYTSTISQKRLFFSRTPTPPPPSSNATNLDDSNKLQDNSTCTSGERDSPKEPIISISSNESSDAGHPNGIRAAFAEFFRDVKANIYYDAYKNNKIIRRSFNDYINILKGSSQSKEEEEKNRMKQEAYEKIIREKRAEEKEAEDKRIKSMSWSEYASHLMKSLSEATSTKRGAMALLEHCTVAHMAEVAVEEDIDVKNIRIVLESRKAEGTIEQQEVVVGYIDAPAASEEEVRIYASKLTKACPAARMMKNRMEWRKMPVHEGRHGQMRDDNTPRYNTSQEVKGRNTTDFIFPGAGFSHNSRDPLRNPPLNQDNNNNNSSTSSDTSNKSKDTSIDERN